MFKKIWMLFLLCSSIIFSKAQSYTLELLDSPATMKYLEPIYYYRFNDYAWVLDKDINPYNVTKGYHNEGLSALLVDKKIPSRADKPFDFLHINLDTKAITRIPVVKGNNTSLPQTGMGNLRNRVWGFDNKIYYVTIAPTYMVSFDPYNNTVHDFGNPFGNGANCNVVEMGKDSAIYGGSEVMNGKIYTFRFDTQTSTFKVDSLEAPNASMAISIQGDKDYTYIVTGRAKMEFWSINRSTGAQSSGELLLDASTNAGYKCDVYHDTIQFPYGSNIRIFENGSSSIIATRITIPHYFESINYPSNVPNDTANYPLVAYADDTDSLCWRFRNSTVEYHLKINPTITQVPVSTFGLYKPGVLAGVSFLYSKNYFTYNIANNSSQIFSVNGESTYGLAFRNSKMYVSAYPSGDISVWNPDSALNISTIHTFNALPISKFNMSANPRTITEISVDPITGGGSTGKFPQVVPAFAFINDTLLAWGGNINSDCSRRGNGGGLGTLSLNNSRTWVSNTIDSAVLLNLPINNVAIASNGTPYFSTFLNHCNEADKDPSKTAAILKYNITEKKIDKYISPFQTVSVGQLVKGIENQIIGFTYITGKPQNIIYFLSEINDEVYKIIDFPETILSMRLGYDNNLWVLASPTGNSYKFYKVNPYSGNYSEIFSFTGVAELQTYTGFIFVGGDAYLSGGIRLARIANLAPPVSNSYLSLFEKANGILNFENCN